MLHAVGIQDLTITSVSYYDVPFAYGGGPPGAISNSGMIVGDYSYSHDFSGYVFNHGLVTRFNYPTQGQYVTATGINNNGVITLSTDRRGVDSGSLAYIGTPGAFKQVAFPGAKATSLVAINDAGVAIGNYLDANGNQYGFIYKPDGTYSTFGPPGSTLSGINNRGDIVGSFLFINGSFDNLTYYSPTSINDKDQILIPFGYYGSDILDYNTKTLEIISGNYTGINNDFSRMNNRWGHRRKWPGSSHSGTGDVCADAAFAGGCRPCCQAASTKLDNQASVLKQRDCPVALPLPLLLA